MNNFSKKSVPGLEDCSSDEEEDYEDCFLSPKIMKLSANESESETGKHPDGFESSLPLQHESGHSAGFELDITEDTRLELLCGEACVSMEANTSAAATEADAAKSQTTTTDKNSSKANSLPESTKKMASTKKYKLWENILNDDHLDQQIASVNLKKLIRDRESESYLVMEDNPYKNNGYNESHSEENNRFKDRIAFRKRPRNFPQQRYNNVANHHHQHYNNNNTNNFGHPNTINNYHNHRNRNFNVQQQHHHYHPHTHASSSATSARSTQLNPRIDLIQLKDTSDELSDAEFAKRIAQFLNEPKFALIEKCTNLLGKEKTLDFAFQTETIEQNGGLQVMNGSRRRTAGGVFLTLIKSDKRLDEALVLRIFEQDIRDRNIAKRRPLNLNRLGGCAASSLSSSSSNSVASVQPPSHSHRLAPPSHLQPNGDGNCSSSVMASSRENEPPHPIAGEVAEKCFTATENFSQNSEEFEEGEIC